MAPATFGAIRALHTEVGGAYTLKDCKEALLASDGDVEAAKLQLSQRGGCQAPAPAPAELDQSAPSGTTLKTEAEESNFAEVAVKEEEALATAAFSATFAALTNAATAVVEQEGEALEAAVEQKEEEVAAAAAATAAATAAAAAAAAEEKAEERAAAAAKEKAEA
eukprot:CAMPEP_0119360348 /NCGR_PEP_ID=MMETSP1334-20130426/7984_1 /TAXON_ID=127549 /ORGANISM="Calcidiscus leptoporus, Strain RCC1130" /LENGTH=164 /DNA_ID=CAMNT_0007375179 /DNA_START=46 /DNA_END=536 /DNA_ORIENTATION=+